MHHSVRSPVTHRARLTLVHARTHTHTHTHKAGHAWSINTHACTRTGRVYTRGIAMERRGRTDIWPEVNDVSNLTLLDKILRDGRGRDLADHCFWATKCNLKLQESTPRRSCHLSRAATIVIDSFAREKYIYLSRGNTWARSDTIRRLIREQYSARLFHDSFTSHKSTWSKLRRGKSRQRSQLRRRKIRFEYISFWFLWRREKIVVQHAKHFYSSSSVGDVRPSP